MSMAPSIRPSSTWSRGSNPSAAKSRGVPMVSSTTKSSSPPAGACSWATLGIAMIAACQASSASAWAASAAFTSAERPLVRSRSCCFSSPWACGICLLRAFCSARRVSKSAIACRRRVSAARASSTTAADSPRLAWAARTRSGWSRRMRGSIISRGPRGSVRCARAAPRPTRFRGGGSRRKANVRLGPDSPEIAQEDPLLDRSRQVLLGWAALSFLVFGVVLVAVVQGWGPVAQFDERGSPAAQYAVDSGWLVRPLRVIEVVFGNFGMTLLTAAVAVLMFVRGHRRAALYTVGVMVVTTAAYTVIKLLVGRARPEWQLHQALLSSKSFPSGHAASVTAFGGILIVLVIMLVRRGSVRRLLYVLIGLMMVVVCLDRVLLGRHFPSDVLGGFLLGMGMVALGLAVYSPLPRSHAQLRPELAPGPFPSERNLSVVLNTSKVEDVGEFRHIVTSMATEAGWNSPSWLYTTVEDPGAGMAEAAAVAGADLVLVCGGDGTVREVCAELAGTGIPVGIVPAGTGNLLARNLDIPLYIRAAIDVALTGQDRAIDLVEVSGDGFVDTNFMVMAGMGFDAAIMEGVNEDIKKRVGWLAYVLSALKSLMFPAVRIEVSVDGGEFTKHRARTVVVGNVGFLQAGMPLLPDAAIDDGQLDVVILHPNNFFAWIPLAWRVLLKRKHTDELVNRMTGATVVVRSSTDTPRQLDGDSIGPGRELRMECIHGRVLARVPR